MTTTHTIKHCHYSKLLDDPEITNTLALFKVYSVKDGALAAVVREPIPGEVVAVVEQLFGQKGVGEDPTKYRVDCCEATEELKATLAEGFPGRAFAYFVDPGWVWRDNGTYEEMPWNG